MQSIPTNGHLTAGAIAARLDRLPQTFTVWKLIILLSFGFFFELYDLLFTGNIAPGLVKSGILTPTTPGLFGSTGLASFVAALFAGLFIGAIACGFLADKYGRRAIFTYSLLWYTATNVLMAFQSTAFELNLWRFLSGIGIGVELVVIGSYLSELVPKHIRGRAFACCQAIGFTAVPVAAFLSYLLVPWAPFGIDGWRWVVLIGAHGAVFVWWIRRALPESPRWLAPEGQIRRSRQHHDGFGNARRGRIWTLSAIAGRAKARSPARPDARDVDSTLSHALNHDDHFQYLPDGELLWLPQLGADITDQAGHHDHQLPSIPP